MILSLDSFVDYSTKSIDTYDIILLGNLRYNNLNQDLSNEYILNDLNMEFKTSSGQISLKEFNELGYYIYTLKSPCSGDVEITLILDNQNITKLIYVPSNTSYGIINNRSGKSYYSIQEAIDSDDTKNGDTILLSRGIFTENIFIYKNITIKAKDIVYLNNFNNSKSTITIFSAGTTIDGLWISADEESYAASIYGVNINFINCNISNSMVGLYLMGSTNTSIVNCNFLDNEYGAYISFSDFSNFTNCSFIDSSYGIFGLENSNLTISKSEFVDCWISLDLINSNNTLIKNNNISKSYLGLELISSTTNLTNNIFIYNTIAYSVFNSSLYGNYNNNFLNSILADFASFDNSEIVIQNNIWSCGPASLATVLHKLGYTQFNQLSIINNTFTNNNGTSLLSLYSYLHNNDIKNFTNACAFNLNSSDLSPLDIVLLNISNDLHYSVIWDITENWVVLADSTAGLLNITRESFDKLFSSYTLVLNGSNSSFDILTVQEMSEIYGTLFDEAWNWLNTPMFYIPGYADFDKNYGVLGQGIKLAGWFLLGIDDDGGISPLNIGLDVISLCSGFGIAERLGVDAGTLVLKASNKFPEIDKFLKSSIKLKGLDFTITAESLFKGYKTSLSFLSNPFKLISTKTIDKVLDKYKYKLAYFAKNYLSSNIVTLSNVLGISKSYNNAKDNILFVSNLVSNFKDGKSINTLIAKSKSSIASTLKNTDNFIKSATSLAKKSVNIIVKSATSLNKKLSNYVTKAVTNVKNNIKKVKNTYKSVVNKVKSSKTYKALSKTYYAAKKVVYNAPKLIKKNIMNYTNRAIKSVTSFFNKIKFW